MFAVLLLYKEFIFLFAVLPKICFSASAFQDFAQICFVVIYKGIFEILRTTVSQKIFKFANRLLTVRLLTVLRSSKCSFS